MFMQIKKVDYDEKHILRNLLELYFYDLSEFDNELITRDLNEAGLYGYRYLDHYWTGENRHPYFLKVDNQLAGFLLYRKLDEPPFENTASEFFVMRKYRNAGAATFMANWMFEKYKGKWVVDCLLNNEPAVKFWRRVISRNNGENIEEIIDRDAAHVNWKFDIK